MGWGTRSGCIVSMILCAAVLAGCGGDDDNTNSKWLDWTRGRGPTTGNAIPPTPEPEPEPEPAQPEPQPEPQPQPATNSAPTLSGVPATSVVAGSTYRFSPKASDADGDGLQFTIQNKPAWASFNSSSGELTGTPKDSDVGTYSNIVLAVTDGKATTKLPAFSITVEAIGVGSATLTWTPPSKRSDGKALTELAGYRVYWGLESRKYTESVKIDNPAVTTYVVENLGPGTYYFATTALSTDDLESAYSNEVTKTIE